MFTLRHVASLLTTDEPDKITRSVLAKLRPLSLTQRETVIRAVLEDNARRVSAAGSDLRRASRWPSAATE